MKILHILSDGPSDLAARVAEAQSAEHEVTVLDLTERKVSYGEVVEEIFSHDKVISW
ncbi:MAG: hypothetical protein PVJ36_00700 [Nitrospirota bacterium]|jgi:hypothetical protein